LGWAEFDGKLYLTWQESDLLAFKPKVRVAAYNGVDETPVWNQVDGGGNAGLSFATNRGTGYPRLLVNGSKLYAAWQEAGAANTVYSVRAAVYNSNDASPAWTNVDGSGSDGLAFNSSNSAIDVDAISFSGKVYSFWREQDEGPTTFMRIRSKVYNGNDSSPSWDFADGGGSNGINRDNSRFAVQPRPIVLNSTLYLIWQENNGTSMQQRVAQYNGNDSAPTWTLVDGGGANGLNWNVSNDANWADPIVANGALYLCWMEYNGSNYVIRVAQFNGDAASPAWSFIDGNGPGGINYDSSKSVGNPSMASDDRYLFAAWAEQNGSQSQVRVKSFDTQNPSAGWFSQDGGSSTGLNFDTNVGVSEVGIAVHGGRVFLAWSESNGALSANQYRVRVGKY
jgi:hypothetical protein